jgi:hypothetical protein
MVYTVARSTVVRSSDLSRAPWARRGHRPSTCLQRTRCRRPS